MYFPLLLLLAVQTPAGEQARSLVDSFASWRQEHGSSWQLEHGSEGTSPEMLYGGRVPAEILPVTDAEWSELGLTRVAEAQSVLDVDTAHLDPREVIFLPLGWIGTTDKLTVSYDQVFEGLPVEGARMNVLFDSAGGLLSFHTSCASGELESVAFDLDEDAAELATLRIFREETGVSGSITSAPRRAWWPMPLGGVRPVWITNIEWQVIGILPIGRSIAIDAVYGTVLSSSSTVHTFDVTGSVRARMTPGTAPDTSSNPEAWGPVPYVKLTGSFGEVFSVSSFGASRFFKNSNIICNIGMSHIKLKLCL